MIELTFTGICEGCKCAELELQEMPCSFNDSAHDRWSVYCTHQDACERAAYLNRILKEKGEDK